MSIFRLIAFSFMLAASNSFGMTMREYDPIGTQPVVITPQGKVLSLYKESHALLISASKYSATTSNGWRDLPSTESELDLLAIELRRHGFRVVRVIDPTGEELGRVIRDFASQRGWEADNRLIIMFSGHGYTNKNNQMGYLVPVDAVSPQRSLSDFLRKALPIKQLELTALEIESRHALFIFDSCFSGSIFARRGDIGQPDKRGNTPSERWRYLSQKSREPVRQFVAAGGPDEQLPGKSVFVPLLLQALKGAATKQADGYVTGKEIGTWIEQMLPSINPSQTPHSDVIRDPGFIFGDMIFQISLDQDRQNSKPDGLLSNVTPSSELFSPQMPSQRTEGRNGANRGEQGIKQVDNVEWSWPSGGKLTQFFDDVNNRGITIENTSGSPVFAAAAGKVVYVGSGLRGYGNLIIVKHNAVYLTAYAHNSELLVKEGAVVRRGDRIASMGSTDSDKTGLHFEIRKQGKPVDPLPYLPSIK